MNVLAILVLLFILLFSHSALSHHSFRPDYLSPGNSLKARRSIKIWLDNCPLRGTTPSFEPRHKFGFYIIVNQAPITQGER